MEGDPLFGVPPASPQGAEHAEREARHARQSVDALTQEVVALKQQLALLHEIATAMWATTRASLEPDSDERRAVERRLDAYRVWVENKPSPCPGCGRPVAARSSRCVFCGSGDA